MGMSLSRLTEVAVATYVKSPLPPPTGQVVMHVAPDKSNVWRGARLARSWTSTCNIQRAGKRQEKQTTAAAYEDNKIYSVMPQRSSWLKNTPHLATSRKRHRRAAYKSDVLSTTMVVKMETPM